MERHHVWGQHKAATFPACPVPVPIDPPLLSFGVGSGTLDWGSALNLCLSCDLGWPGELCLGWSRTTSGGLALPGRRPPSVNSMLSLGETLCPEWCTAPLSARGERGNPNQEWLRDTQLGGGISLGWLDPSLPLTMASQIEPVGQGLIAFLSLPPSSSSGC